MCLDEISKAAKRFVLTNGNILNVYLHEELG
jgi:hypothetical protein